MFSKLLEIQNLSFTYGQADEMLLRQVNLKFEPGAFVLVCGPTGSGKSTLLKTINGLCPHFTGGILEGKILLEGQQIQGLRPSNLAEKIGFVNQQPEGAFVGDTVLDELVYGMEQLGFSNTQMSMQLEWICNRFNLQPLLTRGLNTLSGGQQQVVAIAAALAASQRVLLLDEPTSALSPEAAHQVLSLLHELATVDGVTVILVEHRIERVLELVDSVVVVHGDGRVTQGGTSAQFENYNFAPPVVELSQKLGWQPTVTSIETAKKLWPQAARTAAARLTAISPELQTPALRVANLSAQIAGNDILQGVNFELLHGEVTALIGPNGAGKTTLLGAIHGSIRPSSGEATTPSGNTQTMTPAQRLATITVVPQKASDLLFLNSISKELSESDKLGQLPQGSTAKIFTQLTMRIDPAKHPRDISAGQQLSLALAIQLANGAKILLLDEPTRGLDYQAKAQLAKQIAALRANGACVLVASHDIEFVALIADRVLLLEGGSLVADSPAEAVLGVSGKLPTQMARISGSDQILTPGQVMRP